MEDFDHDSLDLFDDDGDGVNEMCLLFDEESKKGKAEGPPQRTGCCVTILMMGASVISAVVLLGKVMA